MQCPLRVGRLKGRPDEKISVARKLLERIRTVLKTENDDDWQNIVSRVEISSSGPRRNVDRVKCVGAGELRVNSNGHLTSAVASFSGKHIFSGQPIISQPNLILELSSNE